MPTTGIKGKGRYGIRAYDMEVSAISLSSIGFDIASVDTGYGSVYKEFESNPLIVLDSRGGKKYWVAIKNCSNDNQTAVLQARSVVGDDFSKDTNGYTTDLGDMIEIPADGVIYGVFDKVVIDRPSANTTILKLIRGGAK